MSRDAWGPALAGLLVLAAPPAPAQQQNSLGISGTFVASSFGQQPGRRITFICPAITTPEGEVWGTDVYSTDSAVCIAAIHAGVLAFGEAGPVSIVIGLTAASSFEGSARNGVKSQSYANGGYSMTFVKPDQPAAIEWATNALELP